MNITQYLDRGWTLIPVVYGDKKPKIAEWKAFQDNPPASEKMQEWFSNHNNNVGLLMGKSTKLAALDIDAQELIPKLLELFPTDMLSLTPSGGVHLIYEYPEGFDIGNSTGSLPDGVDVRGHGGYILIAPSYVSPQNSKDGKGGYYTWVDKDLNSVEVPGKPSPMPVELIKMLLTPKYKVGDSSDDPEQVALYHRVITDGFSDGKHNTELYQVACYLAGRGTPFRDAVEVLLAVDTKDSTPQGYDQVVSTVQSAYRRVEGDKDKLVKMSLDLLNSYYAPTGSPVKETQKSVIKDVSTKLSIVPLGQYVAENEAETRFLIKDWLPLGTLMTISAPPEAGKTWLMLDMALTVALGNTIDPGGFLGNFPSLYQEPKSVLLFQQEDQPGKLSQRLQALMAVHTRRAGHEFYPKLENGIFTMPTMYDVAKMYVHPDGLLSFKNEESILSLEEAIQEYNAELVCIDPLYSLDDSDDYFASTGQKIRKYIKALRRKYGTTFVFVHHNRKSGGSGRGAQWGSVLLDAAQEAVLVFTESDTSTSTQKAYTVLKSGKAFDDRKEFTMTLEISTKPGQEKFDVDVEDIDVSLTDHEKTVYALMRESAGAYTVKDLQSETKDDLYHTQISRAVEGLQGKGLVTCLNPEDKRGRKYQIVAPSSGSAF